MPASKYDIYAEQGTTVRVHLQYKSRSGVPIDFSGFTGELQVRRSYSDPQILVRLTENGEWGGGTTGSFSYPFGVTGSGGISFGVTVTGGTVGGTGGIMLTFSDETMTNVPHGRHPYDFKVTNTLGETQRLIEGVMDVSPQVTKGS